MCLWTYAIEETHNIHVRIHTDTQAHAFYFHFLRAQCVCEGTVNKDGYTQVVSYGSVLIMYCRHVNM